VGFKVKRTLIFLLITVAAAACKMYDDGIETDITMRVISDSQVRTALLSEGYVVSISITGKDYFSTQKIYTPVSKIKFPAVPIDEEISVRMLMFPLSKVNDGENSIYAGLYPEDKKQRHKVDPTVNNITMELTIQNSLAGGGDKYIIDNGDGTWDEMHVFLNNGSLTFQTGPQIAAQILVVGGGGGGGGGAGSGTEISNISPTGGGGGGGGGVSYKKSYLLTAASYGITVGSGGSGGNPLNAGNDGSNSSFKLGSEDIMIAGGGGGGGIGNGNNAVQLPVLFGKIGGGGGGGVNAPGGLSIDGDGGCKGGMGSSGMAGGGGGGSAGDGERGGNGINGEDVRKGIPEVGEAEVGYGGPGGKGVSCTITGKKEYYGGGGGGMGTWRQGAGGAGGGGAGASLTSPGKDGADGYGGGGGGGIIVYNGGGGGDGGDGVVIVRFPFSIQ
jgi:hypothetical protein